MNNQQIEYFMAVARNSSFSKAAEELYISQPTISRQISALEHELGFTLFDRTTRATEVTAAGKIFYEYFDGCISGMLEAKEKARVANGARSGSILLACKTGWNVSAFLPKILKKFNEEYPGIRLTLESLGFKELLFTLYHKQADAIITLDVTLNDDQNLCKRELTSSPRLILYSANHPLAEKEDLQPIDFKDEIFLVISDDEVTSVKNYVREYCRPYGFEPKIIQSVPNLETMYDGVQNGLGVAISDYWARDRTNSQVRYVTLNSSHTISLAWLKGNKNPALPILVNELVFIFDAEQKKQPASNE